MIEPACAARAASTPSGRHRGVGTTARTTRPRVRALQSCVAGPVFVVRSSRRSTARSQAVDPAAPGGLAATTGAGFARRARGHVPPGISDAADAAAGSSSTFAASSTRSAATAASVAPGAYGLARTSRCVDGAYPSVVERSRRRVVAARPARRSGAWMRVGCAPATTWPGRRVLTRGRPGRRQALASSADWSASTPTRTGAALTGCARDGCATARRVRSSRSSEDARAARGTGRRGGSTSRRTASVGPERSRRAGTSHGRDPRGASPERPLGVIDTVVACERSSGLRSCLRLSTRQRAQARAGPRRPARSAGRWRLS